jgi:O-antigen/teichoic acid export membrane protein
MSLKKQTLSGILWTFTDTFVLRGLSFVASIILARLLGPTEFGLIGMISVFIALGTSLVDSGLSASIIRTQNADDRDYSTVFYLNLMMSAAVYGLLFFAAPWIADFYGQEILVPIIRLYCFSFVISAFSAIQTAMLNKEMQFKKIMQYNVPGTVIGVILGIVLGYMGYGVWSIVWMYLSTQLIQSIMLWSFSKWKPSLTFSKEKLKFHYGFGYKLMLSGLLNTSYKNIYNVLIGKFYSVQSLGFYERANSFNTYPVTVLTSIISKVSYPLLSKIQDQKERIATVYKQLIQFAFFVTAPMMLGAAAIARPLFLLVLGDQWLPAVPFFQILCLSGMFYPIHAFNINVLKVYGRSDLFLKLELIKKGIITVSILIAFQFGIYGLVWSSVFTSIIALMINTHYSSRMIHYTTWQQVRDIVVTLIKAGLMAGLMWGAIALLNSYSLYWQIIIPAVLGMLFYILVNFALKAPPLAFAFDLIKKRNL